MKSIYLDHAATTPVDPRVVEAMEPYFSEVFGNPSSLHWFGQQAEGALENAREILAAGLNGRASEILFTSCGSESDNLALRGMAFSSRQKRGASHLLISPVEHPAVSETAKQLEELHGFKIELLEVDRFGAVPPEAVAKQLRDDTALVSVMAANNEIGTINPIKDIGRICQERGVPFHSDAVQYAAHYPLDASLMNLDLISLGAHKFHGPKGVGALFLRKGLDPVPMQTGGSQEFGLRAATQNIPLIVGMARAFQLVQDEGPTRLAQLVPLRDRIIEGVLEGIPDSQLTGHPRERLPNHASFVFKGVDGNLLIQVLDASGFACSSGSACKMGDPKPSTTLTRLGYDPNWALGSLRVTLGKDSTLDDVDRFLGSLPRCIQQVRGLA
jgi:cysteine desulfurase